MTGSVQYSPTAIRDLDRVWEEVYEACCEFDVTARYLNGLLDKIESKAEHPLSGAPLYYENSFTGYYYVVYKAYLAFYRVDQGVMYVDRVLFGRSDYLRNLPIRTKEGDR